MLFTTVIFVPSFNTVADVGRIQLLFGCIIMCIMYMHKYVYCMHISLGVLIYSEMVKVWITKKNKESLGSFYL